MEMPRKQFGTLALVALVAGAAIADGITLSLENDGTLSAIGLLPGSTCLVEWVEVNAERARIKAAGGVIYGPVQYTFDIYYRVQNSNLEYALKKALADSGNPWFSDADVRARYEKTVGEQSYEEAKYGLLRDLCEDKVDQLIENSSRLVKTQTNRYLYDSLSF
jgi:hypothetical protein